MMMISLHSLPHPQATVDVFSFWELREAVAILLARSFEIAPSRPNPLSQRMLNGVTESDGIRGFLTKSVPFEMLIFADLCQI